MIIIDFVKEVNCSGADVQVISCHCCLFVFHSFVEHLASRLLYQLQCACIICAISRLNADSAEQVYTKPYPYIVCFSKNLLRNGSYNLIQFPKNESSFEDRRRGAV